MTEEFWDIWGYHKITIGVRKL